MATLAIGETAPAEPGLLGFNGPLFWVGLWVLTGVVLNASWVWFYQNFWILMLLFYGCHALWGVWLLGWYAIRAGQERDRKRAVAAFAMLVLLPAMFFGSGILSGLGERAAFVFLRPAYDRVIKEVAEGKLAEPTDYYGSRRDGLTYAFREGRRDLVSFRWTEGIPDGGSAIVHDPTDQAATITSPGMQTPIANNLRSLFGEGPQYCEHFADPHYYRCGYD